MRVLDLDLDFFVHGTEYWMPKGTRLDSEYYPPWSLEDTMRFLEGRCRLAEKLPGFVVEDHGEVFRLWREGIRRGDLTLPLSVTHVDGCRPG